MCLACFYFLFDVLKIEDFSPFSHILLETQEHKIVRDGVHVGLEYLGIFFAYRPHDLPSFFEQVQDSRAYQIIETMRQI